MNGNVNQVLKEVKNMLSKIPIDFERIGREDLNKEILRVGILAELDAVNLYEQMAAMTDDKNIKKILVDIAKEEKTHVGEFQALLLKLDGEQKEELEKGKKEVDELTGTLAFGIYLRQRRQSLIIERISYSTNTAAAKTVDHIPSLTKVV